MSAPDVPPLSLAGDERPPLFDEQAIARAEFEIWRWWFRILIFETILVTTAFAALGSISDVPMGRLVAATIIVGGGCFASGLLLILLSTTAIIMLSARERMP